MRTRSKLLLAGLAATLLMSFAVSSASANRLSINNTRTRITWSNLEFVEGGGTSRLTCRVTLEGSFHSATIRKVLGALIGYVTRGIIDGDHCEGGRATILQTSLPWHITYDSFTGVLPDITGISLLLHTTAFQIEPGAGVLCLYAGDATHRLRGTVNLTQPGGLANSFTPLGDRILRRGGSFLCPEEIGYRGTGQIFLLGTTQRINITLI